MPPKSLTLLREKTEWIHYTAQKAMCYWGALSQQELTHTTESGKAEQSRLQETQGGQAKRRGEQKLEKERVLHTMGGEELCPFGMVGTC